MFDGSVCRRSRLEKRNRRRCAWGRKFSNETDLGEGRRPAQRETPRGEDYHGAFGVPGINATIARGAHVFPPLRATRGEHAPENRSEAAGASADPDLLIRKRKF
jgi:hypothetical protein